MFFIKDLVSMFLCSVEHINVQLSELMIDDDEPVPLALIITVMHERQKVILHFSFDTRKSELYLGKSYPMPIVTTPAECLLQRLLDSEKLRTNYRCTVSKDETHTDVFVSLLNAAAGKPTPIGNEWPATSGSRKKELPKFLA